MAIFPKLSLWRSSLCSNLGGIDPEKLYRATLSGFEMAPETRSSVDTISLRVVYLRIISSFSRQTSSKYCAVAESFRLRPVR